MHADYEITPPTSPPTTATAEKPVRRSSSPSPSPSTTNDSVRRATHRWSRWLHVYTSMIALLIVLFFGITGITLNHPNWTFGDSVSRVTQTGSLATDPTFEDGSVNWLGVAEEVRSDYGVKGTVSNFSATGSDGNITFVNAGYAADLTFDTTDGRFDLTVEQQGFVAVMNDLHKGRDTQSTWSWVIDVSAGFLVVISITGLTMQFFLRKRRRSALISAVIGGVISVILIWITIS